MSTLTRGLNYRSACLQFSGDVQLSSFTFNVLFQIQAFGIANNRFGHYNDCVGFFTVAAWMGVVTMLVMLAIVLLGVSMLLTINTMDRYDDPKGKTITITATD